MRQLIVAAIASAALLQPLSAAAQEPNLPKWDAGASFGLLWGQGWHQGGENYDEPFVVYHIELGRFWTTHLKTDTAVILTNSRRDYDYEFVAVSGLPGGYSFTEHERQLTAASGAVTYQFFENQMMHPFVSAGLHVGSGHDHAYRNQLTHTANRVTYTIPAIDTETTTVLVRPFFAVGAKSYFNERTFIRSEFAGVVGSKGLSHGTLRLGFGFDF